MMTGGDFARSMRAASAEYRRRNVVALVWALGFGLIALVVAFFAL